MHRALPLLLTASLCLVPVVGAADDLDEPREPHDEEIDLGVSVFSVNSNPERTRVRVLDLIVVSLFKLDRRDGYERVEILNIPFFSLVKSTRRDDRTSTRFPKMPLIALYRNDRHGDSERDTRILSLPLIGSLFGHQVDGSRHKRTFFYFIRVESDY